MMTAPHLHQAIILPCFHCSTIKLYDVYRYRSILARKIKVPTDQLFFMYAKDIQITP